MSYAAHFNCFLQRDPQVLQFASHRQHPLPDVSFEAQQQAWFDSATDNAAQRLPQACAHIARSLKLPAPSTLRWASDPEPLLTPLFDTAANRASLQLLCMDPLPPALAPAC